MGTQGECGRRNERKQKNKNCAKCQAIFANSIFPYFSIRRREARQTRMQCRKNLKLFNCLMALACTHNMHPLRKYAKNSEEFQWKVYGESYAEEKAKNKGNKKKCLSNSVVRWRDEELKCSIDNRIPWKPYVLVTAQRTPISPEELDALQLCCVHSRLWCDWVRCSPHWPTMCPSYDQLVHRTEWYRERERETADG